MVIELDLTLISHDLTKKSMYFVGFISLYGIFMGLNDAWRIYRWVFVGFFVMAKVENIIPVTVIWVKHVGL